MFAVLPESGGRGEGAATVYSVASVGLIWLPIPFSQWPQWLTEDELAVVVSAATTSGRGSWPAATGIRGSETPESTIWRASEGGSRSPQDRPQARSGPHLHSRSGEYRARKSRSGRRAPVSHGQLILCHLWPAGHGRRRPGWPEGAVQSVPPGSD